MSSADSHLLPKQHVSPNADVVGSPIHTPALEQLRQQLKRQGVSLDLTLFLQSEAHDTIDSDQVISSCRE
jgi:hypothetical protein